MLRGRRILLGVTGGIAAYKAAALCSKLVQGGAEVRVVMTESATRFVAPLTFQTLSRHEVATDLFAENDPSVVKHIDWADWAELIVIAPATANIIAKMATGLGDDLLSTILLASEAPVIVAPAMNVHMFAHPAVQANMETLARRGVEFIDPGEGQLACGYEGKGRLAEPEQILAFVERWFTGRQLLAGRRVLVTAGGTIERIDAVRYITNDSSGKMGTAIAAAAAQLGAEVTLVAANMSVPPPSGVKVVRVRSAAEMKEEVLKHFPACDIVIKAAAVADYRPRRVAAHKIKKTEEVLRLELVRTDDILAELGKRKEHQYLVGFAAETENVEQAAMDKLKRKNCDLIVANDVSSPDSGFASDFNSVTVYDRSGEIASFSRQEKTKIAMELLRIIAERTKER